MKKSCSFEIEMGNRRMARNSKRFEQNLQRFEKERHDSEVDKLKLGGTLEMDYVPHKPPVAHRRTSSMKGKSKSKSKEKFNTITGLGEDGKLRDFVNQELVKRPLSDEIGEKTFEMYVAEKGIHEDDNMDSLELHSKPMRNSHSVDSLDEIMPAKTEIEKIIDSNLISSVEYTKFLDIEKKINVIKKLVELEEQKLEQEKAAKEKRMQPFECDPSQKGYVKS